MTAAAWLMPVGKKLPDRSQLQNMNRVESSDKKSGSHMYYVLLLHLGDDDMKADQAVPTGKVQPSLESIDFKSSDQAELRPNFK